MHNVDSAGVPEMKDDEYPHGKGYSYYVLVILSLLYLFDFIDRQVVTTLFGSLKAEWGLSDAQCGYLVAIVNVSIAILALPSAVLVDRWSRKNMVGIMATFWGLSSLACAFSGGYMQLLVLRFLVGAGEAGYGPGANSIVQCMFPPNKRNGALGLMQAAGPFGVVIGMILGGIIAQRWGWRHAFGIVAIPGIIIAIMAFFLKEPARVVVSKVNKLTGQQEKVSLMEALKKLITTPTLVCIFFAMAMSLIFLACVGTWMPSYFRRIEGLSIQSAALKGASVMVCSGIGTVVGGYIADHFGKKNASGPLYCAAVYMLINSVSFLVAFTLMPPHLVYPVMMIGAFFMSAMLGPAMNGAMTACHQGLRATAIGLMIVVQNIFGFSIGAAMSGKLSDIYAQMFVDGKIGNAAEILANAPGTDIIALSQAVGLKHALATLAVTPFVAAILFFLAGRFFKKDCEGASCFE